METVACQPSLSLRFPGKECWNGLPFPSPCDPSDSESERVSCAGRQILYNWATRKAPLLLLLQCVLSHTHKIPCKCSHHSWNLCCSKVNCSFFPLVAMRCCHLEEPRPCPLLLPLSEQVQPPSEALEVSRSMLSEGSYSKLPIHHLSTQLSIHPPTHHSSIVPSIHS